VERPYSKDAAKGKALATFWTDVRQKLLTKRLDSAHSPKASSKNKQMSSRIGEIAMELRGELIIVFCVVVALTLWAARTFTLKRARRWVPSSVDTRTKSNGPSTAYPTKTGIGDSADQLRLVSNAEFSARKLLSFTETRVFKQVEKALVDHQVPWRAMAQVNLGEILACEDERAFRAINSKRVDILVVSHKQHPIVAIEYQGSGHHQGDAAARDAVKKEALRRAGVGYIEIFSGDHPTEVHKQIGRFIEIEKLKRGRSPSTDD
jgi:Protein of unknown function (DUF2726)